MVIALELPLGLVGGYYTFKKVWSNPEVKEFVGDLRMFIKIYKAEHSKN
jgi:uncharacterized membrane protein YjdF